MFARIERERRAAECSKPMRNMFDLLEHGECYEVDGKAVMRLDEIDETFSKRGEWVLISPSIRGWVECWSRLAPDISTYHMQALANRLDEWKSATPVLVAKARAEFNATVARLSEIPPSIVASAITTTQISMELQRLNKAA